MTTGEGPKCSRVSVSKGLINTWVTSHVSGFRTHPHGEFRSRQQQLASQRQVNAATLPRGPKSHGRRGRGISRLQIRYLWQWSSYTDTLVYVV